MIPIIGARIIFDPKLIFAAPDVLLKLYFICLCIVNYHFLSSKNNNNNKNQGKIIENFSGFSSSKPHCSMKGEEVVPRHWKGVLLGDSSPAEMENSQCMISLT